MEMAQREFEVPEGTKILLVFPEIFDGDILSLYPEQFGYKCSHAGGKVAQMGYKMSRPDSNKFVDFEKKIGYKSKVGSIAQYKDCHRKI